MNTNMPTASALNQQRSKLKADALEAVFNQFNSSINTLNSAERCVADDPYRFLAADGSTFTFFSKPSLASVDYYCSPGHSAKGVYSMHLNAFFDLKTHIYTDALIQVVHNKNEFSAFCDIVDRHDILEGIKNIYIGDRGYCSYNNMAHVINYIIWFIIFIHCIFGEY
ncbi:MAG: transposase [Bacillota bacterium]|nr:transposase [Bacillota bacterium]